MCVIGAQRTLNYKMVNSSIPLLVSANTLTVKRQNFMYLTRGLRSNVGICITLLLYFLAIFDADAFVRLK